MIATILACPNDGTDEEKLALFRATEILGDLLIKPERCGADIAGVVTCGPDPRA